MKDEEHLAAFDVPGARVTEAPARRANPVADQGRCTAEEAITVVKTAALLPPNKTAADVENRLALYSDDYRTYAGEDKAMMREHQLRLLVEPAVRTTIGPLTQEERDLAEALRVKLNIYSEYVEWEGDLAVVRGSFTDWRNVGRQAISERFTYAAKRDGKCVIVGLDYGPVWERWGPEGLAEALSGYHANE